MTPMMINAPPNNWTGVSAMPNTIAASAMVQIGFAVAMSAPCAADPASAGVERLDRDERRDDAHTEETRPRGRRHLSGQERLTSRQTRDPIHDCRRAEHERCRSRRGRAPIRCHGDRVRTLPGESR